MAWYWNWVKGVWEVMKNTRFAPSSTANSPNLRPWSVVFGWVRMRKPPWGNCVMESAPETVARKVFDSQQSGATAVVTADDQVPTMAETLSTSMSFRAARTPASGLVWSSSEMSWTGRPSTPPAAFTSSTTALAQLAMTGP
jgi:hypothetical protein